MFSISESVLSGYLGSSWGWGITLMTLGHGTESLMDQLLNLCRIELVKPE